MVARRPQSAMCLPLARASARATRRGYEHVGDHAARQSELFLGGGAQIARGNRAVRPRLNEEWGHLARGLDPEHQEGLQAVLQRARRLGAESGADAAFLALLIDYELELQRVLARLAWLEADLDPSRRHTSFPAEPSPGPRVPQHAPEDAVEEDPEEPEQGTVSLTA